MRRVLAVDDHPVSQLDVRGLLELRGCRVEIAADRQQAIEWCCAQPPDLVLMDVHMPRLDALEATRQLRALPSFPILAATAMHGVQDRLACHAAGMDGYLKKPLQVQALHAGLQRVLPFPGVLQAAPLQS